MSVQKQIGVVAVSRSGMATGSPKHHARHRLYLKLWGVILICAVVLAAIVVGVIWLVSQHYHAHKASVKQTTPSVATVKQQSLGLTLAGHPAAAQQVLDSAIAASKSKVETGQLYEQKASLAYSNSDFTSALQFAQKADALNPTVNSANLIATSAQALGNNGLALQYYKLELQRGGNSMLSTDKQELELNIKALGG
jgi:hypothetical protein